MGNMNLSKMKVTSVLIHPRTNVFLVQVTRSEGYFTYPQIVKCYSMDYANPRLNSFVHWVSVLSGLNLKKIVNILRKSK